VLDDVVAIDRARRNDRDVGEPDACGKPPIVGGDGLEAVSGVPDQIHLVHGQHDVTDAEERDEVAVAAGLREHALAGIDEDHGEVRRRSGRDHVAGVLLVTGGVGHDELAAVRREEPIGDVDGDALHPFRHQPIDHEGEVEVATARPQLPGIGLQRGQVVVEEQLRLVEQPTDQGRLAVVDRAAGHEAEQSPAQMRVDIGQGAVRRRAHRTLRSTLPVSSVPSRRLRRNR
jgi:hypothetical protein